MFERRYIFKAIIFLVSMLDFGVYWFGKPVTLPESTRRELQEIHLKRKLVIYSSLIYSSLPIPIVLHIFRAIQYHTEFGQGNNWKECHPPSPRSPVSSLLPSFTVITNMWMSSLDHFARLTYGHVISKTTCCSKTAPKVMVGNPKIAAVVKLWMVQKSCTSQ